MLPKLRQWLVLAIFWGGSLDSAGSTLHFRATGVSLSIMPVKILLVPIDRSALSLRHWTACEKISIKFSGVRSAAATSVVHSIYIASSNRRVLIGQLNYYGTIQLKGPGRSISFLLNKRLLGLPSGIGYSIPLVLEIVANKPDTEGGNPSFAEVSAWCV